MEGSINVQALLDVPAHLLKRTMKLLDEQIAQRPSQSRLNVLEARRRIISEELARRHRSR